MKLLSLVYKVFFVPKFERDQLVSTCFIFPNAQKYAIHYRRLRVAKPTFPKSKLIVFSNIESAIDFTKDRNRTKIFLCLARNVVKPARINIVMRESYMGEFWSYFNQDFRGYGQGFTPTEGRHSPPWGQGTRFCDSLIPLAEVE